MKNNQKVQIQSNKKLDRMFWLLLDQNQDVRKNILDYKEKHTRKTQDDTRLTSQPQQDFPAANLRENDKPFNRKMTGTLRSASGVVQTSPKVTAGSSMSVTGANTFKPSDTKIIKSNGLGSSQSGFYDQISSNNGRRVIQKNVRQSHNSLDQHQPGKISSNQTRVKKAPDTNMNESMVSNNKNDQINSSTMKSQPNSLLNSSQKGTNKFQSVLSSNPKKI